MERLEAMTGLRGIAALMVVGYHGLGFYWVYQAESGIDPDAFQHGLARWGLGAGWLGVDVFFVLSGFLLAQPFLRRTRAWPTWDQFKVYGSNRLLRIVPPYYASFVVVYLVAGMSGHPLFEFTLTGLLLHAAYLHGFFVDHFLVPNSVAWTLAVEMQFYVVLPLLVLPFRRFGAWPALPYAVLAIGFLAVTAEGPSGPDQFMASQLPAFLGHFGFGIAAAWAWQRGLPDAVTRGRRPDLLIIAALLILVAVPIAVLGASSQLEPATQAEAHLWLRVTAALAFAIAIPLILHQGSRIGAALAWRPLVLLGQGSYSLYLVHFAVTGALMAYQVHWAFAYGVPAFVLIASALSFAVAIPFYYAIEKPSLRLKAAAERRLRGGWSKRPTLARGPPPGSPPT